MATTITTPGGGGTPAAGPQAALDLVRPVQPLLAGFTHRNKNQHRGARWFASFAMLRRHVDKLGDETAAHAARRQKQTPKKKKKPAGRDTTRGINDDEDYGPAPRRARWLRDVLVPKCYLVFSQLAADNQFATLGVVLLGALAQVHRACVCMVGEVDDAAAGAATAIATASALAHKAAPAGAPPPAAATKRGGEEAVDVGEAMSRDELAHATADRAQKKRKKPAGNGNTHPDVGGVPDEASSHSSKADGGKKKPAKKTKKAKKGDEFDDLFSSLF